MSQTLAVLDGIHRQAGHFLGQTLEQIEEQLLSLTAGDDQMSKATASTVAAGGKRLRPLLLSLIAGEQPADSVAHSLVVRAGAAVELIHTATLIHDDVLDDAPLRRGKPTVYSKTGRRGATTSGDWLFARSFQQIAELGQPATPALKILADSSRRLATGELMQRIDAWQTTISRQRYLDRCIQKTAALFECSAQIGAVQRGVDPQPFIEFARSVGLAFQLFDDCLDVEGDPAKTGKPVGTDLLDGTVTLPFLIAMERDQSLREIELRSLKSSEQAEVVCKQISASGAIIETEAIAVGMVQDGLAAIPAETDENLAATLSLIGSFVVGRQL